MSRDYHLLCRDCRVYLHLGKVYRSDTAGSQGPDEITFSGAFSRRESVWHKQDAYFGRVIEKFLITHRNHELRFVPEGVDELLEAAEGKAVSGIEADDLLGGEEPEPSWDEELDRWRLRLEPP